MWKSFLTRADDALPFFASLFHVVDFPMNTFSPTQHELPLTSTCSGTSRYICFGTFELYGHPKNVPKKVLVTLFPYIFHVKRKWNIVYRYLKTKTVSRESNILPQRHWTSNIFGHSATITGGFWVSLNYPMLNFKKTVRPKNV